MNEEKLFDESNWLGIAMRLPELRNDPEGAAHLITRFVAQYLPALLRSQSEQDFDRVWLAFWHYLVAPRTRRKPFGLSSREADELIAEFQIVLGQPG